MVHEAMPNHKTSHKGEPNRRGGQNTYSFVFGELQNHMVKCKNTETSAEDINKILQNSS